MPIVDENKPGGCAYEVVCPLVDPERPFDRASLTLPGEVTTVASQDGHRVIDVDKPQVWGAMLCACGAEFAREDAERTALEWP